MKRLLIRADDLVGKTIAFAEGDRDELLISFTDDTYAYMEASYEMECLRLDFRHSMGPNYLMYNCEQLCRMEIIDADEYARLKAAADAANLEEAKQNAEREREQYEALKRKFAGEEGKS